MRFSKSLRWPAVLSPSSWPPSLFIYLFIYLLYLSFMWMDQMTWHEITAKDLERHGRRLVVAVAKVLIAVWTAAMFISAPCLFEMFRQKGRLPRLSSTGRSLPIGRSCANKAPRIRLWPWSLRFWLVSFTSSNSVFDYCLTGKPQCTLIEFVDKI